VITVEGELHALDSGAKQAFIDFQELVPNSEHEEIIIEAKRFIRDYPLSPDLKEVRGAMDQAQASIDAGKARAAKKESANEGQIEAKRRTRLAKFRAGRMTAIELKAYLGRKTEQEIIFLMGQPQYRQRSDIWDYRGAYGLDEYGRFRGIRLYFIGGRVSSVGLLSR